MPSTGAVVTNIVTDPYSLALTTNSARSVIVDLDDRRPAPAGWNYAAQADPGPARGLDDLRAARARLLDRRRDRAGRATAGPIWRSPHETATACSTCATLADAGLNTVHLLPVFDIATIPEVRADQASRPAIWSR